MIGIYKITSPTNKVYIGQSQDVLKRFKYYKRLSCKNQTILYRSFLKYGVKNHTFEILCVCLESELNDLERHYQELFNCVNKGLNCEYVNDSNNPKRRSKETALKISKARKGMSFTKDHCDNIRKSKTGNRNAKSIIVLDLSIGVFYESIAEAGNTYSIDSRTLSRYLNGTRKNITNLISL